MSLSDPDRRKSQTLQPVMSVEEEENTKDLPVPAQKLPHRIGEGPGPHRTGSGGWVTS